MDELVRAALAKWPNVPDVYGWLSLTARGEWLIRGEPISHGPMKAFIGRNYAATPDGCWFFQNGPQRVFVELDATPYVARLDDRAADFVTHNGLAVPSVLDALQDESGRIVLVTPLGPAILLDRDLGAALEHPALRDRMAAGLPIVPNDELADRFGFQRSPQPKS